MVAEPRIVDRVDRARLTREIASAVDHDVGCPIRRPNVACAGTLERQSPASNMPMLMLYGCLTPRIDGSISAFISRSNPRRASTTVSARSTGLTARSADSACADLPSSTTSSHTIPTPASNMSSPVGSGRITASASTAARAAASVPFPVHSSSITDRNVKRPADRFGCDRDERVDRERRHREAALHVARAPAVEAIAVAASLEGRRRPQVGLVRGDDVDVPVQQERWALVAAEPSDHVASAVVGGLQDPGERSPPRCHPGSGGAPPPSRGASAPARQSPGLLARGQRCWVPPRAAPGRRTRPRRAPRSRRLAGRRPGVPLNGRMSRPKTDPTVHPFPDVR